MIEFCNVKLSYVKEYFALYNLNLKVENGEKVGVVGGQDDGKTSFLRILAKLEDPTSGEVYYDNIPLDSLDYAKDLSVAYIASKPILLSGTIKKNLNYVLKLRKIKKEERGKIAVQVLEDFGLSSIANQKIKRIGTYQKRLLQFAMLSIREKIDLLLVDDILQGLTDSEYQNIKDIMKQFMKKDTTVFFATSTLEQAKELCDKIVYLKLGAIEKIENNKLKIK